MIQRILFTYVLSAIFSISLFSQNQPTIDILKTSAGDLQIISVGHGSLYFVFGKKVIHVDPYGKAGDYSKFPKADIILLTHDHSDHFDVAAIDLIKKKDTDLILTQSCFDKYKSGTVMKNGESKTVKEIKIDAVPAYNILHKKDTGELYHPKGTGNGYVITFGDKKVYVAGDTENIPEMKDLKNISITFLPMNLPFTMTQEMVVDAVNMFKPKVLYVYHIGNSDTKKLIDLLKDNKDLEVRIRVKN
jgi:L-ascorbate metabolism protein UlaG (beta-lactamase superfamily)